MNPSLPTLRCRDMTTPHDIALLRLAAQRIAGPGFATATDVVRWLAAAQAQDYPGAVTSIALRTESRTRQNVEAALTTGEVIRSWPMRGTLHFVVAEDLPWMLDLTTKRLLAGAASRRAALGLDMPIIEHARQLATDALAGGRQLPRDTLQAIWDDAGLLTVSQRSYHLIWHLAQTGTLCYGPVRDGAQYIVLLDEWVPHPRRPDREEALGEWALRYFHSHGPATVKDFAWWTKLIAADVKTGFAIARPQLERIEVDGVEYFMHPETPKPCSPHRSPHFRPQLTTQCQGCTTPFHRWFSGMCALVNGVTGSTGGTDGLDVGDGEVALAVAEVAPGVEPLAVEQLWPDGPGTAAAVVVAIDDEHVVLVVHGVGQ